MLVTRCPHCGAHFRATPDQMNQRQGQVRCGQCQRIFNAFESVVRPPPPTSQPAAREQYRPEEEAEERADTALREPLLDAPTDADQPAVPPEPREPETPPSGAAPLPAAPTTQKTARPARAWALGTVLMLVVLGLQIAYVFRAQLARSYPQLRPALEAACAQAGCKVPWVNEEAALKLEDSEMLEVPGKPGQIALQARIRNLSTSAQEYPHIELTLTDTTGQPAVRRVLRPEEYLGATPQSETVMAAGSEALISIRLETGRVRATGYELYLFQP